MEPKPRLAPVIGTAHTDTTSDFPRPMGATPRRRKNAVDEDALNAECTGDESGVLGDPGYPTERSPRSRALAIVAGEPAYDAGEWRAENRELRQQVRDYERACAGLMKERDQLVVRNAELREANLVLESRIVTSGDERNNERNALLAENELLRRALRRSNPFVADWPAVDLLCRYGNDPKVRHELPVHSVPREVH